MATDNKTLVCHWDEKLNRYRLIWVPDLEAHLADERFVGNPETSKDDREPNDFATCNFED